MFVFCKMIISLLSSLLNIIIGSVIIESMVGGSVGAWCLVGWLVVGRSVIGGFNKTSPYDHLLIQQLFLVP